MYGLASDVGLVFRCMTWPQMHDFFNMANKDKCLPAVIGFMKSVRLGPIAGDWVYYAFAPMGFFIWFIAFIAFIVVLIAFIVFMLIVFFTITV